MADLSSLPAPYIGRLPRVQSDYEQAIFDDTMREFSEMQTWRNTTAAQWEECSELIAPEYRNTFMYGNFNWPGQKKTDRQIDSTGALALERFQAICDSLLTPRNMFWHGLEANNDYVMKDRATRLWFEKTTKTLFKYRYSANANFVSQNQGIYRMLGAFGTAGMFVDKFDGMPGLRYKSLPLGELYIRENHQGLIDGFIRWFRLTAYQAEQKWPGRLPESLWGALAAHSETKFNFLHRVVPRADYEPDRLDVKGKKWASYYCCIEGKMMMSEGGYNSFPLAGSRYTQAPGEVYGRSPAMMVLPALKTLNAEKRTFLKQGHRAVDPVYLTADDGIVDFSMRPGALNKGGLSADGKELVKALESGQIQISKEMMQEEKLLINDSFLVNLFQILTETPQMTATEVIERTNEKGILLAPTVGRQQAEYIGPLIHRELDLLSEQGLLEPMPPRLREARGEYDVVHTSPLSRAMRAQEAAGFLRTVETAKEIVGITGDQSILDVFDFDTAMPAIARIQSTPESWMSDSRMLAAKRALRGKREQLQATIQAAPAQAAMMKAQAVAQKNGVQQPQPQQRGGLGQRGGMGGQPPQNVPQGA